MADSLFGDDVQTLTAAFDLACARFSRRTALHATTTQATYAELDRLSRRIARRLALHGPLDETPIGICLNRSIETTAAMLGVMRAGGAFLPLEPTYPFDRLAYMVEDSHAPITITRDKRFAALAGVSLVDPDTGGRLSPTVIAPTIHPDSLAYVLYTSGSTGRPKGVMGTHRGTLNRFRWMWREFPFEAGEIACQKTSISFGDSIWEQFGPLLAGVRTTILDATTVRDPLEFCRALKDRRVTRVVVVPSYLRVLLEAHPNLGQETPSVRYWICSGEALTADLAEALLRAAPGATLLNLYGSSEVSADITFSVVRSATSVITIGRPIANNRACVVGPSGDLTSGGEDGELLVGGDNLGRGYLGRAAMTAERFIPDAFSGLAGKRLFRTGDSVRRLVSGEIEYRGRLDHQVKIRGMRVELEEVEARLREHLGVKDAAVIAQEVGAGDLRLFAYVVPRTARAFDDESTWAMLIDLRSFLEQRLPDYMVPAQIVPIAALPHTPSGKVARSDLRAPTVSRLPESALAPGLADALEGALREIWTAVLGTEIRESESFFDHGGNSLLAGQLVVRIRERVGIDMRVRDVFDYPRFDQFLVRARSMRS